MSIPSKGRALNFVRLEEALGSLLGNVSLNLEGEIVDILDAVGRYVYRDYTSFVDLPPFDRSAIDGVAVRFSDIVGASEGSPVVLRLVGKVDVDSVDIPVVRHSEAILVSTGAPIPTGADVVIPIEHCLVDKGSVYVYKTYPKYANISRRGEDLRSGDLIVRKGVRLRPWHVAALAASGYKQVEVFRKIRIAVINTGDELLKNVVPNTTLYIVTSFVREIGGEVTYVRVVPDSIDHLFNTLKEALRLADILIVTGGTSVGERDITSDAIMKLEGARRAFHGVRIRPGRTAGAYLVDGKPILAISGLPVAAYISLSIFLVPIIGKVHGAEPDPRPVISGVLTRRLPNEVGFRSFYRVIACRKDDEILIVPLRLTGSGILSTLIKSNAILEISEDLDGYEEGSRVSVVLTSPVVDCATLDRLHEL